MLFFVEVPTAKTWVFSPLSAHHTVSGVLADTFLDGVAWNWVQAFGLSMAIVTTVLFAVYAADSEQVIDIEATAKEQQVHNLRSRLAAAQEESGPEEAEPAETELGEPER